MILYLICLVELVGLFSYGLVPQDIHYIICTKAHSGKVGNLNLFVNAVQIVAGEIGKEDRYLHHGFHEVEHHGIVRVQHHGIVRVEHHGTVTVTACAEVSLS